ncbi:MAG: 4-hydroxy-tetrahydrodipicolinate reductase [Candidatus Adiutrix sp.]|jgi:4-hydroxy-tetrahydrodipicolinate reductase|nr:4-hydroxy-tetrahydrodipicolinate reductase [Candidatus Adiutrix sp.]
MGGPVKVAVCGALGRMGQRVVQAVLSRPDLVVSGVIEYPGHPRIGQNIGPLLGQTALDLTLAGSLGEGAAGADLYIDFTSVESSLAYLEEAAEINLAAVVGTTGFSPAQEAGIRAFGRKIPVLWAPNMSTGVNVLYQIAVAMARMLGPDFDLEIVEAHHRLKKDAPSGTAVKLYRALAEARGLDPAAALVSGREGLVGRRTDREIGVLALRGGDIVGDHSVYFCGPGERLELTHRAGSRDTFAQGAVRAAAWLAGKPAGFYGLEDTLAV